MKLTESKLKQIIKEELQKVIIEQEVLQEESPRDAMRRLAKEAGGFSKLMDLPKNDRLRVDFRKAFRARRAGKKTVNLGRTGGAELRTSGPPKPVVDKIAAPGGTATVTSQPPQEFDAAAQLVTARPAAKFGRLFKGLIDKTSAEQVAAAREAGVPFEMERLINAVSELASRGKDPNRSSALKSLAKSIIRSVPAKDRAITKQMIAGLMVAGEEKAMAAGMKPGAR